MLDLIERIGSEFGVPIIMSSHLLGEIERVCEHLVVIAGGPPCPVRADVDAYHGRPELLIVEVDGDDRRRCEARLRSRACR